MTQLTLSPRGDSTQSDHAIIQDALDAVEARGGGIVRLTSGTYYIGPPAGGGGDYPLKLGNNTHLALDVDATIIRRFQGGAEVNATIRNKNQSGGNTNIRVTGGNIRNEADAVAYYGKHLGFKNVQYLHVSGMRFLGVFDEWNTSFVDCEDVVISDLFIDSGGS